MDTEGSLFEFEGEIELEPNLRMEVEVAADFEQGSCNGANYYSFDKGD